MISIERHPLVRRDLREMVRHIVEVSGDVRAASMRLDEVEALLERIVEEPALGARLDRELSGWRVRHGGRGRMITIVFRLAQSGRLQVPLVAFGGRDWITRASERRSFFGPY